MAANWSRCYFVRNQNHNDFPFSLHSSVETHKFRLAERADVISSIRVYLCLQLQVHSWCIASNGCVRVCVIGINHPLLLHTMLNNFDVRVRCAIASGIDNTAVRTCEPNEKKVNRCIHSKTLLLMTNRTRVAWK